MKTFKILLLCLAVAAVAVAGTLLISGEDGQDQSILTETQTTQTEASTPTTGEFDPSAIYSRMSPGVVTVVSVFAGGELDELFGGDSGGSGVGSGFVISKEGEIVTNAHVVTEESDPTKKAREVYVQFGDSNQVQAEIKGVDPDSDIALLKVFPKGLNLKPLELGSSDKLRTGTPIVAIGSPYNEPQSLSVGVISAVDRTVRSLNDYQISGAIQTDAAINPGNSGGPSAVAPGVVIGVNQQIKSTSGGGNGVGFAVPINLVKRSIEQLRKQGRVDYALLGVTSTSVYPQLAERFKLGVKKGAWVQTAQESSPAGKAGLKGGGQQTRFQARQFLVGGDVLTKINGVTIDNSADVSTVISHLNPNQKVRIEYYRGTERKTAEVTLGKRPAGAPR